MLTTGNAFGVVGGALVVLCALFWVYEPILHKYLKIKACLHVSS